MTLTLLWAFAWMALAIIARATGWSGDTVRVCVLASVVWLAAYVVCREIRNVETDRRDLETARERFR